jgi:hypothetical protein
MKLCAVKAAFASFLRGMAFGLLCSEEGQTKECYHEKHPAEFS